MPRIAYQSWLVFALLAVHFVVDGTLADAAAFGIGPVAVKWLGLVDGILILAANQLKSIGSQAPATGA